MAVTEVTLKVEIVPREGSRLTHQDALTLHRAFQEIRERNGALTAELVVAEAKNPKSRLHRFFDFDLARAAEKHWLAHAGQLLRSVAVRVIEGKVKHAPTRALVVVTRPGGERSYEPVVDVLMTPAWRDELLAQALRELRQFERRYSRLVELAGVFVALRKLAKKVA